MPLRRVALLVALVLPATAACSASSSRAAATPAPRPAVAPTVAPEYEWPGVWQLVGHDFPDGSRWATFLIERLASGELTGRFTMQGPPGDLQAMSARGDSLHVRWLVNDGGPGGRVLEVRLGAVGDSVTGRWTMDGSGGGLIEGRRLRE